jgi:hypothetical protein
MTCGKLSVTSALQKSIMSFDLKTRENPSRSFFCRIYKFQQRYLKGTGSIQIRKGIEPNSLQSDCSKI